MTDKINRTFAAMVLNRTHDIAEGTTTILHCTCGCMGPVIVQVRADSNGFFYLPDHAPQGAVFGRAPELLIRFQEVL